MSQSLLMASATSARIGGAELLGYFRIGCGAVKWKSGKKAAFSSASAFAKAMVDKANCGNWWKSHV